MLMANCYFLRLRGVEGIRAVADVLGAVEHPERQSCEEVPYEIRVVNNTFGSSKVEWHSFKHGQVIKDILSETLYLGWN